MLDPTDPQVREALIALVRSELDALARVREVFATDLNGTTGGDPGQSWLMAQSLGTIAEAVGGDGPFGRRRGGRRA